MTNKMISDSSKLSYVRSGKSRRDSRNIEIWDVWEKMFGKFFTRVKTVFGSPRHVRPSISFEHFFFLRDENRISIWHWHPPNRYHSKIKFDPKRSHSPYILLSCEFHFHRYNLRLWIDLDRDEIEKSQSTVRKCSPRSSTSSAQDVFCTLSGIKSTSWYMDSMDYCLNACGSQLSGVNDVHLRFF